MRGFVERSVAAGAGVDASIGLMFIIFACEWGLGSFLTKNTAILEVSLRIWLRRSRVALSEIDILTIVLSTRLLATRRQTS